MSFDNFTDERLIEELAIHTEAVKAAEAACKPIREELLKRHRASGETSMSHNGWRTTLKAEPFSMVWLKRETGYEKKDLPPECFTEQFKLVPEWSKVNAWMIEHHGDGLPTTHTITFQRDKKAG